MTDATTIARTFLSAWNAGETNVVDDLAAADLIVNYTHFPEPLEGVEAFKAVLKQTHSYFPDLRISAEEILPVPGGAVVRWVYEGTHQEGELFGVRPSGQRVRVNGISIIRIDDGLVREETGIVDNLALFDQLRQNGSS